ncbi:CynX/NimT family MFS transporter [Rhodovulum sp. YNF3179]|uniref:MFS transporter n=1 Tax=Rhodovulum sp. YNF3179 TaxID=3425127 RepID=UPI003D34853A
MDRLIANRWFVLSVLFAGRVAMAFQFQSVAALSPAFMARFDVALADIGLLIGLYLAPGLAIALPGGAIGRRFGDRRVIAFGMALMLAGALSMILVQTWEGQILGRFIAGTGGVLLNVLMSKVVTDHFAGREIATAMGIFVNSWPVGIAAALLFLPLVGNPGDPQVAQTLVAVTTLAGLVLFLLGTRAAVQPDTHTVEATRLAGPKMKAVILAGAIWGLYNGALGMVFGFGPAMLVEQGWTLARASASTSIVLWLVALSLPLGGFLADRFGQRDAVMILGFVAFGLCLCVAPNTEQVLLLLVLLGVFAGIPAGPIMSLPASVLDPGNRALGMGVFFTLFYVGVVFAPIVGGLLSDLSGTAKTTFYFGAAMIAVCCVALVAFKRTANALKSRP